MRRKGGIPSSPENAQSFPNYDSKHKSKKGKY